MPPKMIEKLQHSKNQQKIIINQLNRYDNFLDNVNSEHDVVELKYRLTRIKPLLDELDKLQIIIESLENSSTGQTDEESTSSEPLSDPREQYESLYYRVITRSQHLISKFQPDSQRSVSPNPNLQPTNNIQVKLPTLEIPNFDGEITQWPNFYNTFESLIHENKTLSDVQKLQYLKSCLKKEAGNIISDLCINNENYKVALELLKKRIAELRSVLYPIS